VTGCDRRGSGGVHADVVVAGGEGGLVGGPLLVREEQGERLRLVLVVKAQDCVEAGRCRA